MDKKQILITIIVFLISCGILLIGNNPSSVYAKVLGINQNTNNPKQLYHVYLSGKSIGFIKSNKELEDYIDKKQEKLKEKYNVNKVYAPNDLDVIKEITYNEKISTVKEIYNKIEELKGTSSFTIDGYEINIKGIEKIISEDEKIQTEDLTIYTLKKETFENAAKKTITAFIDEDTYEAYLNDTQVELKENETGSYVQSLEIKNEISIKKGRVPAGGKVYQTEEDLTKFLLFGTTEDQKTYVVKAGDTIEEISNDNKLSPEEFLIANTNFKTTQDLLYPGQKVNLGLITPQFDLVELQQVVYKNPIKMETIYKNDSTQYVGYERVEQDGKDGLALVTEVVELVNGEIKNTVPVSNIELSPAINKIIVRGTKKKVITGSLGQDTDVPVDIGSWVWPTISPYRITSPFGWRWGKMHNAVDIAGPGYNSPIKAGNNGIVVQSSYNSYNGNWIVIKHSNNYYTYYGHLAVRNKQVGDVVMAGDKIGTMGETGFATGVHLHYGVYIGYPHRGGVAINPLKLY